MYDCHSRGHYTLSQCNRVVITYNKSEIPLSLLIVVNLERFLRFFFCVYTWTEYGNVDSYLHSSISSTGETLLRPQRQILIIFKLKGDMA